jgi:ribosomal protein S6--L-glutamate ligase
VGELRVAVAGVPGAWSTEQLGTALRALGAATTVFHLGDCVFNITRGEVTLDGRDLRELDGLVVKKLGQVGEAAATSRLRLLQQLEYQGVRVFSPARAIADVQDRYSMTQRLAQAGLPLPRTVVAEGLDAAAACVEEWGQAVVKPTITSKGRGMLLLARDGTVRLHLRRWAREWGGPFYLQEYVRSPGRDIGVAILGGRVVGAYYRVARPGAWLTTTAAEGRYEPCESTPEMAQLAATAAGAFDLDFTVVDLVETSAGYLIYEVSAFGGFAGLWQTQGIDAARLYAEYVVQALAGAHDRNRPRSRSVPAH